MDKDNIYLSSNIKFLRLNNNKTQKEIGDLCGKTDTAVSNWEKGIREPDTIDLANIANFFDVSVDDLMLKDLRFDNAELVDINNNTVKIPVLGVIKAGIPIEAQEDILEYIDIPKEWLKGGKTFYALKINGDSMYPNYFDGDTVVLEKTQGIDAIYNRKDCAVMVNCSDFTFKQVFISDDMIRLHPYNGDYEEMKYTKEEIVNLPISIVGIARQRRTNVNSDEWL